MGIRIHKKLGYALTDVQYDKRQYKLKDLRFDEDKLHERMTDCEEGEVVKDKAGVLDFYRTTPEFRSDRDFEFSWNLRSGLRKDVSYNLFTWQTECGLPNVMLFQPVGHYDWSRYDDIIDYIEETEKRQRNYVKLLKGAGIYPHLGWVRFREAEKEFEEIPGFWDPDKKSVSPADYSQLVGRWDPKQRPVASGALLKHLLEDYRPVIPLDVMSVVWYFRKAFKVPALEIVNSLRPVLYVYWS